MLSPYPNNHQTAAQLAEELAAAEKQGLIPVAPDVEIRSIDFLVFQAMWTRLGSYPEELSFPTRFFTNQHLTGMKVGDLSGMLYRMKPADYWKELPKQKYFKFDFNGDEPVGDCWKCCIAAITKIPYDNVPHFVQQAGCDDGNRVNQLTQEWLRTKAFVMIQAPLFWVPKLEDGKTEPGVIHIAIGPTVRSKNKNQCHAVVMRGDELLYDPHPDSFGLTGVVDRYIVFKE